MANSSLLTTPLIVLNMGGEMLYILQQRLQAQRIQPSKATKVLQDVLQTMFSQGFLEELFKPQRMYSAANVKHVFEKLAHSSIMRLNRSSMDKLFDLMIMGFKLQVVSCRQPQQLLEITLTHLETLKIVGQSDTVNSLIDRCIQQCISLYGPLSLYEWQSLRQALLRFLLDKRVKVSLFLQRKWQDSDGTLQKSHRGPLPYGADEPGTVRYLEGEQVVRTRFLEHPLREHCVECPDVFDMESLIGTNMYLDLPNVKTENRPSYQEAKRVLLQAMGSRTQCTSLESAPKQEFNLLADLVGRGQQSPAKAKETAEVAFRMNLFPDAADGDDETVLVIDIDGTEDYKSAAKYIEDLGFDDIADGKDCKAESKLDVGEKDLLDLMDEASMK